MKKLLSSGLALTALLFGTPASAQPGDLQLSMENGRVTLVARDVPLRQILTEWARVGDTMIVNAEKVMGPPLTLEIRDEPEARALATLLRSVSGYVVAPRVAGSPGPSVFDRIMILPTSRPPAVSAAAPPPFARPNPMAQPVMPPVDDQDGIPEQGVVPPQGGMPPGMFAPPLPQTYPGVQTHPEMQQPGQQPVQQPVMTAPQPGQLPAPPPVPGNPYQPPQPGMRPPGSPGGPPNTAQPTGPGGGPGGNPDAR